MVSRSQNHLLRLLFCFLLLLVSLLLPRLLWCCRWGITEEIKGQALKLSSQGYRCVVPDLYKGKLGVDAEEASHLMNNLDWPAAVEELKITAKWLRDSGAPKVGVTGFCMGGALTMIATQHSEDVTCGAVFYGIPDPAVRHMTRDSEWLSSPQAVV